MHFKRTWLATALVVASMTPTVFAQQPSTTKTKTAAKRPKPAPVQQEVKDLRDLVTTQQQQLAVVQRCQPIGTT